MPRFLEPADLYAAVWPFHCVLKTLGLAPFTYVREPPLKGSSPVTRLKLTTASFCYSVLVCVLICLIFVATVLRVVHLPIHRHTKATTAIVVTEIVNGATLNLTCVMFVVMTLRRRSLIVATCAKIVQIDAKLMMCQKSVYKTTKRNILLQLLFGALNLMIMLVVDYTIKTYVVNSTTAKVICVTNLIFVFMFSYNHHFNNVLTLLRQRFKIINEELSLIIKQNRGDPPAHITIVGDHRIQGLGQSSVSRVKTMREIHFQLFQISTEMNRVKGLPILLSVVSIFINVTDNLYMALSYVIKDKINVEDDCLYLVALLKLLWATEYAMLAVHLATVASTTCREYKQAAILIQEIMLQDNKMDVELYQQFDKFLSQVGNMKLSFSAHEVFDLNYKLLCGMAGAVTTYLVILLQF